MLARAEHELRASGETARKRDPSTLLALTPMERTVAQLVSTGLSNKDVAAQCWLSPRTVAFHLRNVFTKMGVSSRTELARLDSPDAFAASPVRLLLPGCRAVAARSSQPRPDDRGESLAFRRR